MIKITKGNSATIDITLVDSSSGEHFTLSDGDKVLFTIKNRKGETVIQKVITSADEYPEEAVYQCVFEPNDTISLPTGTYDYDCLLVTEDGEAVTFISSAFVITKAIGLYTDGGGAVNG